VPCATGRIDWLDDEEGTATRETGRRLIASNRRARHDYTILKTYEAGIVLIGNEVKSLRVGHASLVEAFVQEHDGELMLHGLRAESATSQHDGRLGRPRTVSGAGQHSPLAEPPFGAAGWDVTLGT
jgi:hypothetical protein